MLRKFFYYIHSKLTICETYIYHGTREDIEDVLQQLLLTSKHGFGTNYDVYDNSRQYYMTPNYSWGTLRLSGLGGLPIKIYFEYSTLNVHQQEIKIFTTVRPENWFLLVLMIILTALLPSQINSLWPLLLVPLICILQFFVFNFFCKLQEHALIKDVKKTIGLVFSSKY